MKWSSISDRAPAMQAIAEFDQLGRDAFLSKYGFSPSSHLFVRHDGKRYDIKALAGATRGYADPTAGPLANHEFSSGRPVVQFFRRLGFEVIDESAGTALDEARNLRAALQEVLAGYVAAKANTVRRTSPMWQAMERAAESLRALLGDYPHLDVQVSVGKGNWADVPWISILDDRVTDTTRRGVYLVYLFRADMTGVYWTFNQGVTELISELGVPAGRQELVRRAVDVRTRFAERVRPSFAASDGIDLRSGKSGLGAQYEASTIMWRLYESGSLPEAQDLLNDLYKLADVYDEYATGDSTLSAPDVVPPSTTAELTRALLGCGFTFEPWQVAAFVHSLRTKPFVILAGISGTGKSKLPILVGRLTGAEVALIPVRPDWTDSADLLGYTNLHGAFVPGSLLELAAKASNDRSRQYIALLDEMNLARVEQYFAEVLSLVEDRAPTAGGGYSSRTALAPRASDEFKNIRFPANLAIVGTVNMDESTHGFSRKVLDRAFTLELSEVNLAVWRRTSDPIQLSPWPSERWRPRALRPSDMDPLSPEEQQKIARVIEILEALNRILATAQLQVGYRVRDEIAMFVIHADTELTAFTDHASAPVSPLDIALCMKVLPRVQGGSGAIRSVLRQMLCWAHGRTSTGGDADVQPLVDAWAETTRPAFVKDAMFPRTAARLCLMWERLQTEGYTSYWL